MAENLVGYAKTERKVDRLATVRFGSARYSVPARLVGAQVWVSVAGERCSSTTTRTASHSIR